MPSKADLSGTTLPRRQLGRALREARSALGATLEQVARDTEFSRAMLSRIELGKYERVKVREVEYLCRYYGIPEERTRCLTGMAAQSNTKVWWQNYRHFLHEGFGSYLELEGYATEFQFYQPLAIPGLLQTADYARAVYRAGAPDAPPAEIDRRVDMRIQRRARLFNRHRKPQLEFVLHESVLHIVVGSNRSMASQCRQLADMSTRDNFEIRVVPFTAGLPAGDIPPPFIVLDFQDGEPSVVHAEGAVGSMTFEDKDDVESFRATYGVLRDATLGELPSRDRIRKIARRHEQ